MINPAQIPNEVVEAAAVTLMGRLMVSQQDALHVWSGMYEPEKEQFRREARAAIAAGLAAWPGIQHIVWDGQLILHLKAPLPLKEDTRWKVRLRSRRTRTGWRIARDTGGGS